MDGVLADMESELARQAEKLWGTPARTADERAATAGEDTQPPENGSVDVPALPTLNLTSRQQGRLWRHVQAIENFWETLDELEPNVVARLGSIAASRGWEVIFLTKRPAT